MLLENIHNSNCIPHPKAGYRYRFDGLMQMRRNTSTLATELLLFYIKPSVLSSKYDLFPTIVIVVLYAIPSYIGLCYNETQLCKVMMTSSKETFSALLALCAGNSPVTVEFPSQRPVARSVDVFFALGLNKLLNKQL